MKLLDVVALTKDLHEQRLYKGQVGTIVELYEPPKTTFRSRLSGGFRQIFQLKSLLRNAETQ